MFAVIRKIFDLLTVKERVKLYLICLALMIMALIEMAGIASILPFMAVVSNPDVIETNRWLNLFYRYFEFTRSQDFHFFLGTLVLGLLVFSNVFKALTTWMTLRYDNRLNYLLARRLLARYLARPYVFFLNRNTAEMGKNVLAEVRNLIAGVLSPGLQFLSSSFVSICILALLVAVDPVIALIIAGVLGGVYAGIYVMVRRCLARIGQEQVAANTMKYKAAGEALSGIKDLKILGREASFLEMFSVHARRHSKNNVIAGVIAQLPRYALEIMAFGGILLIVLHFLRASQGVGQVIPLLALYAFAGYRLMPALQQVFSSLTTVRVSLASLDVVHGDLVGSKLGNDGDKLCTRSPDVEPLPFQSRLELRDVVFRYPEAQDEALKGISLSIEKNTSIGLVGATGSGKTTTVDILLGLLAPTSGDLVVDGAIVDEGNIDRWQCNLGYVPQQIYLCDDTIARNIAFGVPDQELDMEAVRNAARIANLDSFVENELPEGYGTIIGERGVRLSGGQRQRIGIARALYRDPAVLILDEATSALDGVTEDAVMDAIRNLSKEKTIIMIAHRLTTVKDCEAIFLFSNGKIVKHGTYSELQLASEWFQAAAKTGT